MPEDHSQSPVDSAATSLSFDETKREITLEQKPGEQPVTIAGGALGPEVDEDGAKEQRPSN